VTPTTGEKIATAAIVFFYSFFIGIGLWTGFFDVMGSG
jgi:hypothetical protein